MSEAAKGAETRYHLLEEADRGGAGSVRVLAQRPDAGQGEGVQSGLAERIRALEGHPEAIAATPLAGRCRRAESKPAQGHTVAEPTVLNADRRPLHIKPRRSRKGIPHWVLEQKKAPTH